MYDSYSKAMLLNDSIPEDFLLSEGVFILFISSMSSFGSFNAKFLDALENDRDE